jgi:predicted regulator of Ras-like GTPase activity (Roadblock/LC7/MglB family)
MLPATQALEADQPRWINMFGFLKTLLRKPQDSAVESEQIVAPQPVAAPKAAPLYRSAPQAQLRQPAPRKGPVHQNGKGVEVSLQKILEGLPLELQPRVAQTDVGDLTISIPLEKVLAQLSRGVVKISFGELRQAAPEAFTLENDRDRVLVPLPLGEILARLNPALITRRRVQKQVEVPEDISSPFDANSTGAIYSVGPGKPAGDTAPVMPPRQTTIVPPAAPAPSSPVVPITPIAPNVPAIPAVPLSARGSVRPGALPTPPTPAAPTAPPLRVNMTPVAPAAPPASIPSVPAAPIPFNRPAAPAAPTPSAHLPSATPAPSRESNGKVGLPQSPVPQPPAAAPGQPGKQATGEALLVSLAALAEAWAESVRKEIVDLNLVDAKVALPVSSVEQALKQGRIAFSWKTVRSWIKPAVSSGVSAQDGMVLELPLKVVAPLFLARQKENNKNQQKVAVDEEIPNLFFGYPQPESAPGGAAETARPSDTNYYVWDESNDTVKVHESELKRGPSPGTKFVAKYATPNEVVSRAASLEGVAGALIALPDGLMVANRLPPELNADTLAAFLPQIFGKVSSCTKELRMGELNNLNFTVGNVPWKIFRVNAIFFAAFGRAGEPLPTSQLAALAGELDHKPK